MRHQNKGFTLIEVAVTVTILAIATSMVIGSMSSVYSRRMQTCAVEINNMIAKCRISTMSRAGGVWLRIEEDSHGITVVYCEGGEDVEVVEAGKRMLRGSFTDSTGATRQLSTDGPLYIAFWRGTGKLLTIGEAAKRVDPGSTLVNSNYVETIVISYGDASRSISLVPETGKHFLQ